MEKEIIEIRNNTDKEVKVSDCRTKMGGLYVEIGGGCEGEVEVKSGDYERVQVNQAKL